MEMPVLGIANSWGETKQVFRKYGIPVDSYKALKEHFQKEQLDLLISDLNKAIGSSEVTCIEGG
jgi:aspartate/tyrosine/aromatic aminotransferase